MPSSPPAAPSPRPVAPGPSSVPARAARTTRLFRAWRAGDERAGEALFRDLRARLGPYFRACSDDLDDLVQDTLVACVVARHRLRREEALLGYVRSVARRTLLSHRHRHRHRSIVAFDDEVVADRNAPLDELVEARRLSSMASAQRSMVVTMHCLEGRSGAEIARALGISEASAWRRLRAELAQLRSATDLPRRA